MSRLQLLLSPVIFLFISLPYATILVKWVLICMCITYIICLCVSIICVFVCVHNMYVSDVSTCLYKLGQIK